MPGADAQDPRSDADELYTFGARSVGVMTV
jgi:hypothetical protein